MLVITPTSGSADRGQLGDLAEAAHRHLEHEHLGARTARQHLERQPDLGVEVLARGRDRAVRRDHRRDQVLGRGLADRAGDRDHERGEVLPPAAGERAERRHRRLGRDHRAAPSAASSLVDPLRRHDHAPGAGVERGRGEGAAVDVLARAGRRTGRRAGRARESITARAGPPARAAAGLLAHELRAGRARHALGAPVLHARALGACSASRATVTSSNGSLRPPSNSWPCSWPLPAITTMSPGRGELDRAADRGAPVDLELDVPPSRARRHLASTIASGSSERGLSEVMIARSASRAADLPHQRALAAVAVAARAEHARSRARRRSPAPTRSTFSSAPGLCA